MIAQEIVDRRTQDLQHLNTLVQNQLLELKSIKDMLSHLLVDLESQYFVCEQQKQELSGAIETLEHKKKEYLDRLQDTPEQHVQEKVMNVNASYQALKETQKMLKALEQLPRDPVLARLRIDEKQIHLQQLREQLAQSLE